MNILHVIFYLVIGVCILGFFAITLVTNKRFPKTEKRIVRVLLAFIALNLIQFILYKNQIMLRGMLLNQTLSLGLLACYLGYCCIAQPSFKKLVIVLVAMPITLLITNGNTPDRTVLEYHVSPDLILTVHTGGFLNDGNIIRLNSRHWEFFHKVLYVDENTYKWGIHKIETKDFNNDRLTLLLHHEIVIDDLSPSRYIIKNDGYW